MEVESDQLLPRGMALHRKHAGYPGSHIHDYCLEGTKSSVSK